jgi:hypothetical protein
MENALYLLAVLACPLGMGLMMWFMMRGQHGTNLPSHSHQDEELAQLRSEVESLRRTQNNEDGRAVN